MQNSQPCALAYIPWRADGKPVLVTHCPTMRASGFGGDFGGRGRGQMRLRSGQIVRRPLSPNELLGLLGTAA